jgi:hypothetical protein
MFPGDGNVTPPKNSPPPPSSSLHSFREKVPRATSSVASTVGPSLPGYASNEASVGMMATLEART